MTAPPSSSVAPPPPEVVAAVAARSYVALVHHPVYDRNRRVVTTAITNLDIHDIARSARTFGLAGYFIVTPVAAQRDLAARILGHWHDTDAEDAPRNEFRREALLAVAVLADVDAARAEIARREGELPLVVVTSARPLRVGGEAPLEAPALVAHAAAMRRPLLILLGTGWGLADSVLDRVDHSLAPIYGHTTYNHLSVRSAAAILLDRLFGQRSPASPTATDPTARETPKEQVS